MADILGMFGEIFFTNFWIFSTIIFAGFAIVPWLALFALNFFNKNVWKEINATMRRDTVKVFIVLQNGMSRILYKKMNENRTITLAKNEDGADKIITPSCSPHPDADSHRQVYIAVEGQEGTKNLLAETDYDVNSPQKSMVYTMAFEDGRVYERTFSDPKTSLDLFKIATVAAPLILFVVILIYMYSQGEILNAIADKVGAVIG